MIRSLLYGFAVVFGVLWGMASNAAEREYQEPFCIKEKGQIEHVLPDRTRVDCLTDSHAIELDYARKWAEAIGQSLHYARMTGKAPGVLLIVDGERDQKYIDRLYGVISKWHLPIQVWEVEVEQAR